MKLIAEHWQAMSLCAFLVLAGVVLLIWSVRDYREQKRGGIRVR